MIVPNRIPSLAEIIIEDAENPELPSERILMQCANCNLLSSKPIKSNQTARINYDITNPYNKDFMEILNYLSTLRKASVIFKADERISKTSPRWFMSTPLSIVPQTQDAKKDFNNYQIESPSTPFVLLPRLYELLIKTHIPASVQLHKVGKDKYNILYEVLLNVQFDHLNEHSSYIDCINAIQKVSISDVDGPSTRIVAFKINAASTSSILLAIIEGIESTINSQE